MFLLICLSFFGAATTRIRPGGRPPVFQREGGRELWTMARPLSRESSVAIATRMEVLPPARIITTSKMRPASSDGVVQGNGHVPAGDDGRVFRKPLHSWGEDSQRGSSAATGSQDGRLLHGAQHPCNGTMSPVRGPLAERRASDPSWSAEESVPDPGGSWLARLPSPIVTSNPPPVAGRVAQHSSVAALRQNRRNEFVKRDISLDAHTVPVGMQPHEADLGLARGDGPPRRAPLVPQHSKIALTGPSTTTSSAALDAGRPTVSGDSGSAAAAADVDSTATNDGAKVSDSTKRAKPVVPEIHDLQRRIQRGLAKIQKLDARLEEVERKAGSSRLHGSEAATDAVDGVASADRFALVVRDADLAVPPPGDALASSSRSSHGTGSGKEAPGGAQVQLSQSQGRASKSKTPQSERPPAPSHARTGRGAASVASSSARAEDSAASSRKSGGASGVPSGGGVDSDAPSTTGAAAQPAKDFISRNMELAGKVRNRALTKEEEDRLREIIGPELMGDPLEEDDDGNDGGGADGRSLAHRRKPQSVHGIGQVSDGAVVVGEDELPLALRQPGFEPPAADKERLQLLDSQLHEMVIAGTACEAASNPYPRPLKLFPVFLTSLESHVRTRAHDFLSVQPSTTVCPPS